MSAACCAFLSGSAACQALPARAVRGIEAADSLVSAEFAKDSIGSITVGVIAGSQLVWTRSVGFADMKTRRLANRNTVYRIGSITKPFTAVMLMQLVAAGRVQLSDPVERYLPEVKQITARPPGASPFTFLQLATMTAGLAREPDEAGAFWTGPVSAWEEKLLAALPNTSYVSFPGTELFVLEHRLCDARGRSCSRGPRAIHRVAPLARFQTAWHGAHAIRSRSDDRI
ncbi:MAG: serine hydrolase domain-containing protein [Gemmatimonadaceae bacterium]